MQPQKKDVLSQLASVRSELETERAEILTRLAGINAALGQPTRQQVSRDENGRSIGTRKAYRRAPGSLEALIVEVTTASPLSAPEILEAVSRAGYVTTAPDPLKVINTVLERSKLLKKAGRGKFAPATAK